MAMAKLLNIAHRGGARLWPENTLYAFAQAARAGCDGAEFDVQLSQDGRLVVFHDYRLKPELCRSSDGRWLKGRQKPIRDLTASELRAFDVGRIKPRTLYARTHRVLHPRDGERIPLLSEVIATVRSLRRNFRVFIEIKTCPEDRSLSAAPETVAEAVVGELRAKRYIEDAVLVGFDWRALIHAKKLEPALACWFTTRRRALRSDKTWAAGFHPSKFDGSIAKSIVGAGGQGWLCSRAQATRANIEDAHRLGLAFGVWTVNDSRAMRRFAGLGADAIVTDRPDRLAGQISGA
jgi:glycerophosphoryl diester phosphodiesterase